MPWAHTAHTPGGIFSYDLNHRVYTRRHHFHMPGPIPPIHSGHICHMIWSHTAHTLGCHIHHRSIHTAHTMGGIISMCPGLIQLPSHTVASFPYDLSSYHPYIQAASFPYDLDPYRPCNQEALLPYELGSCRPYTQLAYLPS